MDDNDKATILYADQIETVNKRWGRELWIHNDEQYCGKILEIDKNARFSMHFHKLKTETWYVISGELKFEWIDFETAEWKTDELVPGTSVHIPSGLAHRLTALTEGVRIMEVSTQHFDSDSYRIER